MCREWRDFQYPPRNIRFGYGIGSSEGKDVGAINLPQFSSAIVPMVQPISYCILHYYLFPVQGSSWQHKLLY